jgi:hypothetical protein
MALDFNELSATTYKNYRKTLTDNIMKKVGLYAFMRKKGRIERREGGLKLVEPLMYGTNSTFKSYSGYDVIDTTPQSGITAAEYSWKNVACSVTISKEEEMENSGESKIINLLKAKITQAEKTITLNMNQMLYGDGTGNGSKDFSGLKLFVTAAASTAGGIDGSTYTWWDNIRDTVANFSTEGLKYMRSIYNQCCREGDKPDIIVTNRSSFEAYEGLLTPIERINFSKGENLAGDLGFETQTFKGCPMMWDYHADAQIGNVMMFLNTDYLKLVLDPRQDFELGEWRVPVNQLAKTAILSARGEMICNNRQVQGRLAITAFS